VLLLVDVASASWALVKVCHRLTHDNTFHLLAYLEMLAEEELLEFQLGRLW
jgi:hypothetical protein